MRHGCRRDQAVNTHPAATLDTIMACVPPTAPGQRAGEIAREVQIYQPSYVRQLLSYLVCQGLVVHEGKMGARRYWRRRPTDADA